MTDKNTNNGQQNNTHRFRYNDLATRTPLKTGGDTECFGMVSR